MKFVFLFRIIFLENGSGKDRGKIVGTSTSWCFSGLVQITCLRLQSPSYLAKETVLVSNVGDEPD